MTVAPGWNDRHGTAIYKSIADGQDPFTLSLGLRRGEVSWYVLWLVHAKSVVIEPSGRLRLWDELIDGDLAA